MLGIDAVLVEVADALTGQERVVDQEVAGEVLGLMEHVIGGRRQNLRRDAPPGSALRAVRAQAPARIQNPDAR